MATVDKLPMLAEGYEKLQNDVRYLKTIERPSIIEAIEVARGHGDLSENAEYHAAKEAQAHLETRILRLREQVRAAVVVEGRAGDDVRHGSTVAVTDLGKDSTQSFKIVSPNEASPKEGLISSISPVAQALIGSRAGDEVEIAIPAGVRKLRVDSIS